MLVHSTAQNLSSIDYYGQSKAIEDRHHSLPYYKPFNGDFSDRKLVSIEKRIRSSFCRMTILGSQFTGNPMNTPLSISSSLYSSYAVFDKILRYTSINLFVYRVQSEIKLIDDRTSFLAQHSWPDYLFLLKHQLSEHGSIQQHFSKINVQRFVYNNLQKITCKKFHIATNVVIRIDILDMNDKYSITISSNHIVQ